MQGGNRNRDGEAGDWRPQAGGNVERRRQNAERGRQQIHGETPPLCFAPVGGTVCGASGAPDALTHLYVLPNKWRKFALDSGEGSLVNWRGSEEPKGAFSSLWRSVRRTV